MAPARGCIASCLSIRTAASVEVEASERFKADHDMPATLVPLWLASPSTWQAASFGGAARIGPNVPCAAQRGWVFSV